MYGDSPNSFASSSNVLSRHVEGLTAVLLSLKKKPIVRYEKMSGMAKKLAKEVVYSISSNPDLWEFRTGISQPILMILDRRNDPVTPLLSQWTYQAMVHELIGITNGRVDLSQVPDVREDMKVCQNSRFNGIWTDYLNRKSYFLQIKIHSLLRIFMITLGILELISLPTFQIIQVVQRALMLARSRQLRI